MCQHHRLLKTSQAPAQLSGSSDSSREEEEEERARKRCALFLLSVYRRLCSMLSDLIVQGLINLPYSLPTLLLSWQQKLWVVNIICAGKGNLEG